MLRAIMKWSVIGFLGVAALTAVVGFDRVKGVAMALQDNVCSGMDEVVGTRRALEAKVQDLSDEYPERCTEIRIALREIGIDLAKCRHDIREAEEVVAVCNGEADVLRARLDGAKRDGDGVAVVAIELRSKRLGVDAAAEKLDRAVDTATRYGEMLPDLRMQESLLVNEQARLEAELAQLEAERSEFRSKASKLKRDIDSLERKERLVKMAQRHQKDRKDIFAGPTSGLTDIEERIARKRIALDEQLRQVNEFAGPENEFVREARLRIASSPAGR